MKLGREGHGAAPGPGELWNDYGFVLSDMGGYWAGLSREVT